MNRDDILPPVLKKDDGFAALGKIIAGPSEQERSTPFIMRYTASSLPQSITS